MVLCLLSRGSRGHWTKLNHEETVRGTIQSLLEHFKNKTIKGEIVIVVGQKK